MYNIPATYNQINEYNSRISPSTVHCKNTGLHRYYQRYLLMRAMSVFKFTLPDSWPKNYFLYTLYTRGFVAVVNTNKFGVIFQPAALKGFNVYYQPTNAVISNPLIRGNLEPKIGSQCSIIKLQPDFGGVLDRINYYADMLALSSEAAGVNLVNSKLAYVFVNNNKASAEASKRIMDDIASGELAVFLDKRALDDVSGTSNWQLFNQNLSQTYIADRILQDMRNWEIKFDTEFGIPNVATEKKERLITDEANSNNVETKLWADIALETLQQSIDETNKLFGLNLAVDYRHREEDTDNEINNESSGSI